MLIFLQDVYTNFMFGVFLILILLYLFFPSKVIRAFEGFWRWMDMDNYVLKSAPKDPPRNKVVRDSQDLKMEDTEVNKVRRWLDEQNARIDAYPEISVLPLVKLTPSDRNMPTQSWFRGPARFPLSIDWPKTNGEDMLFIGQINLQGLPQDLWYGHGVRHGWLLFFMSLDREEVVTRAIHTMELGPERLGPKSSDAAWHNVWKNGSMPWPDDLPAYLQVEVVNLTRDITGNWPNHGPSSSDPFLDQTAFLSGHREVGASYPLLDGYDVPLIELPSDPKFGWNWNDTWPCYICARSKDLDKMEFSDLQYAVEV